MNMKMNIFKKLFAPKYRIRKAIYKNKTIGYYVQYRFLGFWLTFNDDYLGCDLQFSTYLEALKFLREQYEQDNIEYKVIYTQP